MGKLTWETISTIAQQNPPTNPVANIISMFLANTVINQEAENGIEVIKSTVRLPNFMAIPPSIPPNKAPNNDRDATHEASCRLMRTVLEKLPVWIASSCFSCSDAIAGEL